MRNLTLTLLAAGVLAWAGTGCITHEETVYRDEPRLKVELESDAAARIFYETLNERQPKHDKRESSTEVEIPIIFKHKQRYVEGENTAFNQAVRQCDTNQDGIISEKEARIYSRRP